MTKCQVCEAKCSNSYLCNDHVIDLREMLTGLAQGQRHPNGQRSPGWLALLADTAVGQTRRGDGGRRGPRRDHQLDGESLLASHIEAFPKDDEISLEKARRQRERAALHHALAAGGINVRASVRLRKVRATLDDWVSYVETITGTAYQPLDVSDLAATALWLAHNARPIAGNDQAGQIHQDIRTVIDDIERIINRPIPMRFLGPCPTWIEARRSACGTELSARADALEVFCKSCRHTHNCARLQLLLVNDLERKKLTVEKILELNRVLPEEYRIPERTLRRWRRPGPKGEPPKLKPRGYRRGGPDGPERPTWHSEDDVPVYLWADVRRLRADSGKAKAS